MRTSLTQTRLVAQHLLDAGRLTPAEAKEVYGIRRLAARIYEVERKYRVTVFREMKSDALGARYTSYYLDRDNKSWLKDQLR